MNDEPTPPDSQELPEPENIIELGKLPRLGKIEEGRMELVITVWQAPDGSVRINTKREGIGNMSTQTVAKGIWDAITIACHAMQQATDEATSQAACKRKEVENQASLPPDQN